MSLPPPVGDRAPAAPARRQSDLYTTLGPWVGLMIAVVVAFGVLGPKSLAVMRYTFSLVIVYLLLTNTEKASGLIDKLIAGLKGA
jgi:hypothetical protein